MLDLDMQQQTMCENDLGSTLTAIATILLVIVGLIQIFVLISQKRQTRIALTEQYRKLWGDLKEYWGNVVFIGREEDEYYQVLDKNSIENLKEKTKSHSLHMPTIWALESIQKVCGTLGEISTRILQGHLKTSDIYPIFGTEFLRQSRPLRQLLEPQYVSSYHANNINEQHNYIRAEIQDWLIYHDGLRRRCLIIIDLLWAEAARLEDLPPEEMRSAADAKNNTGSLNRKRVYQETIRLNGLMKFYYALKLSMFLKRAEYQSIFNWSGISKKRLSILNEEWTKRILRKSKIQ